MLPLGWRTVLVLGGIHSGKSAYAESLVAGATRIRRVTPGANADPAQLAEVLAAAEPDETLLVDPAEGWFAGDSSTSAVPALAAAAEACPGQTVLVSAEVGLGVAPATGAARRRAETVGAANQALAAVVDAVVLVVAGQPSVLKGAAAARGVPARDAAAAAGTLDLSNLRGLPLPDDQAAAAASEHLTTLGPAGLGALAEVVVFAAGTQGNPVPSPWQEIQLLLLQGDHPGAAAAGAESSVDRAAQLRSGTGAIPLLAGPAGARMQVVAAPAAAPMEDGPASTEPAVEAALAQGWQLAQQAADQGLDLLVLGSIGAGAETAAAAVTAAFTTGEPSALLGWVRTVDGMIDDPAWMRRCAAVRDAVYRVRAGNRLGARSVLAELGGADLAIAAGVVLGAAARRLPVLLDGPVGAAGALAARNLGGQSRHWCLLPDHGRHPTVARAAEALNLTPLFDLRLELGEGGTTLALLPLLRTALSLASLLSRSTAADGAVELTAPTE